MSTLALAAGLATLAPGAFAENTLSRQAGSTANSSDLPPAETPIPNYYQPSYAVYLRMKARAEGGTRYTRATYGKMPDWSGVWTRDYSRNPRPDFGRKGSALNALGPIASDLTPRYRAAFDEKLRQVAAGNEWDALSDCLPAGYPRWLSEPFLREFIVTPDETWWINEQESEARHIYTDGRGHIPAAAAPLLWDGDSIGFWDDQTLVVHTIRVIHGQYQRSQPDYSYQTSTLERIHMVDHDTIADELTVWDPKGLIKPWRVVMLYKRVTEPGSRIDTWSCETNNNVIESATGGSQFILPGESVTITRTYRDPNTFYLTAEQKKLFAQDESEDKAKPRGK